MVRGMKAVSEGGAERMERALGGVAAARTDLCTSVLQHPHSCVLTGSFASPSCPHHPGYETPFRLLLCLSGRYGTGMQYGDVVLHCANEAVVWMWYGDIWGDVRWGCDTGVR